MLILIIDHFHHKNESGLNSILQCLCWEFKYGTVKDIPNYDIIYSPNKPINTSQYPNKKFIFGPHFSVFPNGKLHQIHNICKNSIYTQPSAWVVNMWKNRGCNRILPIVPFPFPVNTEKFKPLTSDGRDKVFIYFKRRKPEELEFLKAELDKRGTRYVIFDYIKRYNEEDYLKYLQDSKYGIILDAHESQGFAIEEALSCNVPLLVWDAKSMHQEHGSGPSYNNIPCTTIPYWDKRCGEYFYEAEELETKMDIFLQKLDEYKPREFILENLSVEKCAEKLQNLIYEF